MVQTWLERLFGKTPAATLQQAPSIDSRLRELGLRDPTFARAVALQMKYWQRNPQPSEWRFGAQAAAWSWPARLAQHHDICWTYAQLASPDFWTISRPANTPPLVELRAALQDSVRDLLAPESPYRSRHGYIWQGLAPPLDGEPMPDPIGMLRARSITHLGSIEVVRLDSQHEPDRIDFVAFADLETLALLPETIFAAGLLVHGDQKTPVLVPTRHGLTWWAKDATLGLLPRAIPLVCASGDEPTLSSRDAIWIGLQELVCDADQLEAGSSSHGLHECYQFSWAESGCGPSETPPPTRPSLNKLRL